MERSGEDRRLRARGGGLLPIQIGGEGGYFGGGVGVVDGEWWGGGDKGEEWGADLGRPGWPDGQLGRGPAGGGASPPFVFFFLFCFLFYFLSVLNHSKLFRPFIKICLPHHNYLCNI